MPLPTTRNPHRSEIAAEFGSNTLAGITSWRELGAMHAHIFGAGLHNREDFKGVGQPTVSSITASSTSGKTIRVAVTGNRNGVMSYVRVRYSDDEFATDDNYGGQVNLNDGTVTNIDLSMPEYDTPYYFRVFVYNAFNDDSQDWNKYPTSSSHYSATTGPPPELSYLEVLGGIWNGSFEITTTWQYGVDDGNDILPVNYDHKITWNNNTYTDSNVSETAVAPTIYQHVMNRTAFGGITGLQSGDSVISTITVKKSGYSDKTNSLAWTVPADQPTNLSISQPDPNSGGVSASWTNQESSQTELQWQINSGGTWSNDGSSIVLSSGVASASKTYSQGQQVRFRVRHINVGNQNVSSNWSTSSGLIVDIAADPNPPLNLTLDYYQDNMYVTWDTPSPTPDSYDYRYKIGSNPYSSWNNTTGTSFTIFDPCSQTFDSFPTITVEVKSKIGSNYSDPAIEAEAISCGI